MLVVTGVSLSFLRSSTPIGFVSNLWPATPILGIGPRIAVERIGFVSHHPRHRRLTRRHLNWLCFAPSVALAPDPPPGELALFFRVPPGVQFPLTLYRSSLYGSWRPIGNWLCFASLARDPDPGHRSRPCRRENWVRFPEFLPRMDAARLFSRQALTAHSRPAKIGFVSHARLVPVPGSLQHEDAPVGPKQSCLAQRRRDAEMRR
jgi:hypothetical protein